MLAVTPHTRPLSTVSPTAKAAAPLVVERLPAAWRRVVIVGGGTSGWMTAMLFAQALQPHGVEIMVLESPAVGIIGVGEGSTPWLRGFFDRLGIEEAQWMPACHATYKCGITFAHWSTRPGFERYFHPFASALDNLTLGPFLHHADARRGGIDLPGHPDRFFLNAWLAREHRVPRPPRHFPFEVSYGYHFDAVLLGQYLQQQAVARGVKHLARHVREVQRAENGDIQALLTDRGERITGDFFVDCSGFAGLLIQQALETPFVGFADNLFNDAAVALPTPMDDDHIPSETVSTALRHGWAWKIPLTQRYGNGYVYSSAFCSADEAERELREHLGPAAAQASARHLKMKVGRVTQSWNRNCLAVGLAQGFIEPLEATALLFIQRTAETFLKTIGAGDLGERVQQRYNRWINALYEDTRSYIVAHYVTNSRTNTEYWRANAANERLPEALRELLERWRTGRPITDDDGQPLPGRAYRLFSWYCLLAGMGEYPAELRAPSAWEAGPAAGATDHMLRHSAQNFRPHMAFLADIASTANDPAGQVYLW